MKAMRIASLIVLLIGTFCSVSTIVKAENPYDYGSLDQDEEYADALSRRDIRDARPFINSITVTGNKFIATQAIINAIPYQEGDLFDPLRTNELIRRLYFGLNRIHNVIVKARVASENSIDLEIVIEEKYPLKQVDFVGNTHLSRKDIEKKIDFVSQYAALDLQELPSIAQQIKKLYVERGYNHVEIDPQVTIDEEDNRVTVTFVINEGKKSMVKRIKFIGNEFVSDKELRKIILSKEDWLFGFLDRSGTYHPEMVEYGDRQAIEHFYQDRGYLHAKVVDIITDIDPVTKDITLTYEIEEGGEYTISEVHAPGNDVLSEEILLSRIPIKAGMPYSRELISMTIKRLERLWGNGGYIFAHIDPSIIPDDETKEVKISFLSDIGNSVRLNRLTIRGNKKTRDKIIRRRVALQEGGLLTQDALDMSKNGIESLGYFEPRDGVAYKIKRLDEKNADVDFLLKEAKTGHAGLRLGYGGAGDMQSPSSDFSVSFDVSDTNLFGSGIHLNTSASWSKSEQSFLLHLAQPWLFDKPILGAFDIYHRRPVYDELRNVQAGRSHSIHEKLWGGSVTGGIIARPPIDFCGDINLMGSVGVDDVKYFAPPRAAIPRASVETLLEYQSILDKSFKPGTFVWLSTVMEQDTRNNPVHTSRGHKWRLASRFAVPSFGDEIAYGKLTLDASWYTPLINEYDLVFKIHGFFGYVCPFHNYVAPFGELFNIGGHNSVRGFLFGQIGPKFLGDPIGAKKAFFVNVELLFPIAADMSIKGVVFYDGGAGWDNPYATSADCRNVTDDKFSYRHSVGVGVRLLKPMPIKIDWGFKIDPRRNRDNPRLSESANEVHFGMTYDW